MRSLSLLVAALFAVASPLAAQSASRPHTRQGFWIGFGLGPGSATAECNSCDGDRTTGFSGYFKLGGTISPSFLLGFEGNGWERSHSGVDESLAFGSIALLWYTSRTGAFFLKVGLGGMQYTANDGTDELEMTAPAASFGLGYEFRVTRNMSIAPFWNVLFTSPVEAKINGQPVPTGEDVTVSLVQLGAGLTWH